MKHQLSVALPRPLPAPQQQGDFLIPPDQGCEIALPGAASTTARPAHTLKGVPEPVTLFRLVR